MPAQTAGAPTVTLAEEPLRMEVELLERHVGARRVVLVGEGHCPHCGWGWMRAEVPGRGFCPVPTCAKPVFAVLRPGARPADAPREVQY